RRGCCANGDHTVYQHRRPNHQYKTFQKPNMNLNHTENDVTTLIGEDIVKKDQAKGLHNLLYVNDLSLWHGKKQTLKNIELNIRDKGITVLLGPSGCGKTTLLKTFNRLTDLYPDIRTEGSIIFEGKNIL